MTGVTIIPPPPSQTHTHYVIWYLKIIKTHLGWSSGIIQCIYSVVVREREKVCVCVRVCVRARISIVRWYEEGHCLCTRVFAFLVLFFFGSSLV